MDLQGVSLELLFFERLVWRKYLVYSNEIFMAEQQHWDIWKSSFFVIKKRPQRPQGGLFLAVSEHKGKSRVPRLFDPDKERADIYLKALQIAFPMQKSDLKSVKRFPSYLPKTLPIFAWKTWNARFWWNMELWFRQEIGSQRRLWLLYMIHSMKN